MKVECETRGRLLDTAMELLWENGFASISVDEICKKADIRKGSFYHFFESKADLAVAALERTWDEKRPMLDETFSPCKPPLQRFQDFCDTTLRLQARKQEEYGAVCGCNYMTIGAEQSNKEESIRLCVIDILGRYRRYLATTIRDAIGEGSIPDCDPEQKGDEIVAHICGLLIQSRVLNSLKPIESMADGIFRLLGVPATAPAVAPTPA